MSVAPPPESALVRYTRNITKYKVQICHIIASTGHTFIHITVTLQSYLSLTALGFHRECPAEADHLCPSLSETVKLFSSPPVSDTVDMVWLIGGAGVYKVLFV